jgi:hypothetical protein
LLQNSVHHHVDELAEILTAQVDYTTQRRIPKDSALWLKQVIGANRVS